jgi:hypothetical protein
MSKGDVLFAIVAFAIAAIVIFFAEEMYCLHTWPGLALR